MNLVLATPAYGFELAWRLSRAYFFLGQQTDRRDLSAGFHEKGVEAAQRTVNERHEAVEGHFWLGVNLALLAKLETRIKAVVDAWKAKRALLNAIALNPGYHDGGPLRVLGRLQHRLPEVLGGGWKRAAENYEKAIVVAPHNTVTRIYFAELLFERGDMERALIHLQAVLDAPPDPNWAFEIERDKGRAIKMLGNGSFEFNL